MHHVRGALAHDPTELSDATGEVGRRREPHVVPGCEQAWLDATPTPVEGPQRRFDAGLVEVRKDLGERALGTARAEPVDDVEDPHYPASG